MLGYSTSVVSFFRRSLHQRAKQTAKVVCTSFHVQPLIFQRQVESKAGIPEFDTTTDVLIIGAGPAGLMGSLRAHYHGLRPLVVEKSEKVGGAGAYSGGVVWIPNNHLQQSQGLEDSAEKAMKYMNNLVGDIGLASSPERRLAFVENAPRIAKFLEDLGFRWRPSIGYPDYHPYLPGGMEDGRSIESDVFNIRKLGKWRKHFNLSPMYPIPPVFAYEAGKVARAAASMSDFVLLMRVMARWASHILSGREPVTLGHSLMSQILKLNLDQNTEIWRQSSLETLLTDDSSAISGAVVNRDGKKVRICARHGVLLTAGGFAKNKEMRERYQQGPINPAWSSVPAGDHGDAIQAGMAVGAATAMMDDAWWGPTMFDPKTKMPFFALWDRARPYSLIVDSAGNRFMNEAEDYVDAGHHQYARDAKVKAIPAWMIVDSNFRRRYPLHNVPPYVSPRSAIDSGVIFRGDTLEDLAIQIGVDQEGLSKTIHRFNSMAMKGVDEDYGRGSNAYDNFFGDPGVYPNPNLGALTRAPFYAVKIFPGDLGTKGGLVTDEHGRVVNQQGVPIKGLYASGNTTASVMGRRYAGAGSTIAPALTFSYLALDYISSNASEKSGKSKQGRPGS